MVDSSLSKIAIVLASYNGECFLEHQIDSIIGQSYQNWELYIRDDGSDDATLTIVNNYSVKDNRIHLLQYPVKNVGAKNNFTLLLSHTDLQCYNYIVFSDQDDVWKARKLSNQLDLMRNIERQQPTKPTLIHSNLEVVGTSLERIHVSFMKHQRIQHEFSHPLKVLLTQNFVTGCTVMVNRALLEYALPIPEEALMHDWWLALCAAAFGHIAYIDKPLVKYRQHGNNEVGAKHISDFLNPLTGRWKHRWLEGRKNLFQSMQQARLLAERIRQYDSNNPHLALVESYASLEGLTPLQRIKKIRQLGIHAQFHTRQTLLFSRLLFSPRHNT